MTLETIRDLKEVNGKKVMTSYDRPKLNGEIDWATFDKMREEFPICIDHETDMVSFAMLTKPASEGGNLNRCQLTDLVSVALTMIKYLDVDFPCRENAMTITKLEEALMWQEKRTQDRTNRNVEGKYAN